MNPNPPIDPTSSPGQIPNPDQAPQVSQPLNQSEQNTPQNPSQNPTTTWSSNQTTPSLSSTPPQTFQSQPANQEAIFPPLPTNQEKTSQLQSPSPTPPSPPRIKSVRSAGSLRIVLICFALILFGILAGVIASRFLPVSPSVNNIIPTPSSTPSPVAEDATSSGTVEQYISEISGISFDYTSNWMMERDGLDIARIGNYTEATLPGELNDPAIVYFETTIEFLVLTYPNNPQNVDQLKTALQITDKECYVSGVNSGSTVIISEKTSSINNNTAYQRTTRCSQSPRNLTKITTYFLNGQGKVASITLQPLNNIFVPTYSKILSTFKFIPTVPPTEIVPNFVNLFAKTFVSGDWKKLKTLLAKSTAIDFENKQASLPLGGYDLDNYQIISIERSIDTSLPYEFTVKLRFLRGGEPVPNVQGDPVIYLVRENGQLKSLTWNLYQ